MGKWKNWAHSEVIDSLFSGHYLFIALAMADLWFNDIYFRHVYQTMCWWLQPDQVILLGDLLGSQWVTDVEFEWRVRRLKWSFAPLGSIRNIYLAGNHDIGK
jgi:hypothetical protein